MRIFIVISALKSIHSLFHTQFLDKSVDPPKMTKNFHNLHVFIILINYILKLEQINEMNNQMLT